MTKKEAAFTLFDAGHSPSCPEIKAINVEAQTRANYHWEWKRGGREPKPEKPQRPYEILWRIPPEDPLRNP